jgi:hypothetical protein
MNDYYLKAATETDMNDALETAGLINAEGSPVNYDVLLDRIGPITMYDYSTDPPTEAHYPEYYANLRLLFEPTDEQRAVIATVEIIPPALPYRVWA